jgi:Cu/Ag efflux protein CusF
MKAFIYPLLTIFAVFLAGCTGDDKSKDTKAKEYDIKGKVTAVDSKKPAVKLDHEDIPGVMKGMEMEFRVAIPKLLEGLKKGDMVQGRLRKDESGYTITRLEKR